MSGEFYECSAPEEGCETWVQIEAFDEEEAAEEYVNRKFSDMDYPSGPLHVVVRDGMGQSVTVKVTIEAVPTFHGEVEFYNANIQCFHIRRLKSCRPDGYCFMCQQTYPELVGIATGEWNAS
jgi:hypothetical protein